MRFVAAKEATTVGSFASHTLAGHHGAPSTLPNTNLSVNFVCAQISEAESYVPFLRITPLPFCLLPRVFAFGLLSCSSQNLRAFDNVSLSISIFCKIFWDLVMKACTRAANLEIVLQALTASLQSTRSASSSPFKLPLSIMASPQRSDGTSASVVTFDWVASLASSSKSPSSSSSSSPGMYPPNFSKSASASLLASPAAHGRCKRRIERNSTTTSPKCARRAAVIAATRQSRIAPVFFVGMDLRA
mmetsp:Transcript_27892/g.50733  ORF Transcript_27892/g.50733 Transcript_27892/m.50733 type:complete len:245 (+) Transcript_27892:400-1134(+)